MTATQTKSNTELAPWTSWPGAFPWHSPFGQLLDSFWHAPLRPAFQLDTEPSAELTEEDDAYLAEIDLPGVEREHVAVDVTDRRLSVHASRKASERTGMLRHTTRSTSGEFDFEMTLPAPIDSSTVTASMADGVLTVRMPKSAAAKSTRIEIST
jgi:HSP20 family protein